MVGEFNNKPIPPNYYNFLNNDDAKENNITGTPIEDILPDNKGVEYAVVPNHEDIYNRIIIDDNDSLASSIYPLQNEILEIEGVDNENKGG